MPPKRPRTKDETPRTSVVVFPFDLFGNAGTGAGAHLLADVLTEAVDDTAAEDRLTRPHAYAEHLVFEEYPFETVDDIAGWRAAGRTAARRALADTDGFALWLSGNHLGVLPVYEELGPDTLVIQFDAHLDCYALHDTTTELSHGNWLLHADVPLPAVVNVGHRDLFLRLDDIRPTFTAAVPAEDVASGFDDVLSQLRKRAAKAKRVWIDIDIDVLDPAFAPAVHEPMPFGLTPAQVLGLIFAVWSDKVVGVSLSEFDPGRDERDRTLQLLAWLLERLLLKKYER